MLASLPLRRTELIQTPLYACWPIELAPSKDASMAGHHRMVTFDSFHDTPPQRTVDVSVLYDQTKPGGGKVDNFTQLDYLELITSMIALISRLGGVLEVKFLDAIVHARDALFKDRQQLLTSYSSGHINRWASNWPFTLPEYDPTCYRWEQDRWIENKTATDTTTS